MSFIKNVLATVTGIFLALFLMVIFSIIILASSSSDPEPYIRDGSVLKIELSGMINERTKDDPFAEILSPGSTKGISMDHFRSNLKKAASDKRIKGIWLDLGYVGGSWANLFEMHDALKSFKESEKFIFAYIGDGGANEASYMLATVADSIFAQPEAMLELNGFYIQGEFYKRAFDKFGIKADVLTTGPYKSAADSYTSDRFSESDREQLGVILSQFSNRFIQAISEYSGIHTDEIDNILNALPTMLASNAYERGLIDGFMQPFEFKKFLSDKAGSSKLQDVAFNRYNRVRPQTAGLTRPSGDKIAVVYMEGPIMPQVATDIFSAGATMISYSQFEKIFNDLQDAKDVAAVVLRVNSPGGAVTTSEILRAHIQKLGESKPVLVSMGAVAASGGYYISMGADSVFAEAGTITGSIGVVMAKLSANELFSDKLGITYDEIKTHQHADWMSLSNALTPDQRRGLERDITITYDNFLNLVADARGLERDYVHTHAQGRVWTGTDALEIGLVDGIGTLPEVVRVAAEKAGLEEWQVAYYPTQKSFIETLMESSQRNARMGAMSLLGLKSDHTRILRDLRSMNRPTTYSIIPFEFIVN